MRTAIVVVYYLDLDMLPILDLHLRALEARTEGEFKILAAAPRVEQGIRERLLECPLLELLEVKRTESSGSKEHSHYLNELCDVAVQRGYDRVCTMDVDAFPIMDQWNARLERYLSERNSVISVFRGENDDTVLPHPSCCYFSRDWYACYKPVFLPDDRSLAKPEFREFLRVNDQRVDSGIGLGFVLWKYGLPWKKLVRTNGKDDHYLIAGIYDDCIFHLGAMSWGDRDFRGDRYRSVILRYLDMVEEFLKRHGWYKGYMADLWSSINYRASRSLVDRTNRMFCEVLSHLKTDPEKYFEYLRKK